MPTSVVGKVRDRVRAPVTVEAAPPAAALIQTSFGWYYRAWVDRPSLKVGFSLDAGVTWEDHTVASDAAGKATPALVRDAWDNISVWYHSDAAAQAYLAPAGTTDWTLLAFHAGLKFPVAARRVDRLLLALQTGSSLQVWESSNDGATLETLLATLTDVYGGRVSLAVDERGFVHLVYGSPTSDLPIYHRYSEDGGATWSAAATLASAGRYATYALGLQSALLSYWEGSTHRLTVLDETYGGVLGTGASAPLAYTKGYMGLLLDEMDRAWIAGKVSAWPPSLQWTNDPLTDWSTPV